MRRTELPVSVVVDELECVNGASGLSEDGMDGLEHGIRVGGRIVLKGCFQSEDGFVARDGRNELYFEEEGDGWAFVCHLVHGNHLGIKVKDCSVSSLGELAAEEFLSRLGGLLAERQLVDDVLYTVGCNEVRRDELDKDRPVEPPDDR